MDLVCKGGCKKFSPLQDKDVSTETSTINNPAIRAPSACHKHSILVFGAVLRAFWLQVRHWSGSHGEPGPLDLEQPDTEASTQTRLGVFSTLFYTLGILGCHFSFVMR